jgi:hypothetical protein
MAETKSRYKTIALSPETYIKLNERKNKESDKLKKPISFDDCILILVS